MPQLCRPVRERDGCKNPIKPRKSTHVGVLPMDVATLAFAVEIDLRTRTGMAVHVLALPAGVTHSKTINYLKSGVATWNGGFLVQCETQDGSLARRSGRKLRLSAEADSRWLNAEPQ